MQAAVSWWWRCASLEQVLTGKQQVSKECMPWALNCSSRMLHVYMIYIYIYIWSIYDLYYLYLLSWHCTESSSDLGMCGRTGLCSPVWKDGPRGHNAVPGELRLHVIMWLCRTLPGAASDALLPGPTNLQLASVDQSMSRSVDQRVNDLKGAWILWQNRRSTLQEHLII